MPSYNFTFKVQDCSSMLNLQCLGETGEQILGMKVTDFYIIHDDLEQVKQLGMSCTWR